MEMHQALAHSSDENTMDEWVNSANRDDDDVPSNLYEQVEEVIFNAIALRHAEGFMFIS